MRREDRRLTHDECLRILTESSFGVLAMSAGNEPYAVPLNHYFDGEKLYFHMALSGRKIEILHENPKVSFVVSSFDGLKESPTGELCGYGAYFSSVICSGTASFITENVQKAKIATALTKHLAKETAENAEELSTEHVLNINILAIEISEISGKACLKL
jgi:nitroimidazol reductase NimA-like FMN-containing flavoprotein (pyridoxamine 5'-phosphate oxidase superfamily)